MSIYSINGCIFLGTSIGYLFKIESITYATSIFCIIAIYKLLKTKYKKVTYIYSILMIAFYIFLQVFLTQEIPLCKTPP